MDFIYVVEEINSGDTVAFRNLKNARDYVANYYIANMKEWYTNESDFSVEQCVSTIQDDLNSIFKEEMPYIQDVMYTRRVELR